ncbi:hypothetical protein [Brevibacterium antiquum]|uniref:Uncharacterized protein n=1 Tax=Brevibacterium antiquum TaxID=234835 RepID=A0A2H1INA9_9MICO|nr:hypothetical protein [Brevibacterium antiquum]SMX76644.1 hypothetical protein BANT10_01116 [Brevibacterium antiquum]
MSEYVPSDREVRETWMDAMVMHSPTTSSAEFDRFIDKVKADERQSLLEELTADAEHEARIGEQGNDSERVNAAEKIIEMLNDIQIEREA